MAGKDAQQNDSEKKKKNSAFILLLKGMTKDERLSFLQRFAIAFGRSVQRGDRKGSHVIERDAEESATESKSLPEL